MNILYLIQKLDVLIFFFFLSQHPLLKKKLRRFVFRLTKPGKDWVYNIK